MESHLGAVFQHGPFVQRVAPHDPGSNETSRNDSNSGWKPKSIPEEHRIRAPEDVKDTLASQKVYASFGNDGTTASVNAHGHIMQISRFLGYGHAGFLVVDLDGTPEPYIIQSRMDRLMELCEKPNEGIRLEVQEGAEPCWKFGAARPSLEFVHDRWPRFTQTASPGNKNDLAFSLQYFCNRGTIFQTYTWQRRYEDGNIPELPRFEFDANLLIRDLDFMDPRNRFNDSYEGYGCETTSSTSHLLIRHKRNPDSNAEANQENENSDSQPLDSSRPSEKSVYPVAGLVVAPFAYGKPQKFRAERDSIYSIVLSEDTRGRFASCGILEITVAYRLESRSTEMCWKDAVIEPNELEIMNEALSGCTDKPYQRIRFSDHQHLDFVIRRNLEHILAVCSIPVMDYSCSSDTSSATSSNANARNSKLAIALTCGDISGHRVTSSASFFAFMFLVSMFQYLSDKSKRPRDFMSSNQPCECEQQPGLCAACTDISHYLEHLQQRIRTVCDGHVRWVYKKADEEDGTFCPHYWATGKRIPDWQSSYFMTPHALTDTPFQVIKMETLMNTEGLYGNENHPYFEGQSETLNSRCRSWIRRLEEDDDRGKFAFPRPSNDGTKTFYLTDHFWIHQAMKFVIGRSQTDFNPDVRRPYVSEDLFPDELRESMIRRFRIVNPDTKKPMLATSRTPLETRFKFHPTDTALFYAMDQGFFLKPSEKKGRGRSRTQSRALIEEWKSTLDAQADYDVSQTLDWTSPLQYALALAMGSKEPRVNHMSTKQVVSAAKDVLLKSTSLNGLFPGLLKETGEPTIFQDGLDRDDYWHAAFEVPFLVWTYGRDLFSTSSNSEGNQFQSQRIDTHSLSPMAIPSGDGVQKNDGNRLVPLLKSEVPFSNLNDIIDQKGLVEISDDWLLGGSGFLEFGSIPNALCFQQCAKNDLPQQEDASRQAPKRSIFNDLDGQHATSHSSLESTATSHEDSPCFSFSDEDTSYACETIKLAKMLYEKTQHICDKVERGIIIDIPRKSDGSELEKRMMTNDKIFRSLAQRRRVQDAKKRLIWLPEGDKVTALMCYLASPKLERDNMSAFLDRHTSYDKFFYDGVAPFQNEWETELHLSYFSLLPNDPGILKENGSIPYLSYIMVEEPQSEVNTRTEPTTPKTLARATMSFRFVGDFFDRYWTCHILEFDPNPDNPITDLKKLLSKPRASPTEHAQGNRGKKYAWQQRKVLELLLFQEMLKRIKTSTRNILDWVRSQVSETPKRDTDFIPVWWPANLQGLEREEDVFTERLLKLFRAKLSEEPFTLLSTYPLNPLAEALEGDIRSKQLKGSDGYFSKATLWRFFESILQAVEDDLQENLEKIEEWSRREEDRGLQKPRWTRNDERRYGSVIKTLRFQTRREIHELQRLKASIIAFREPRSSKLSTLRDDFSFRSSENINLFTYVTVVFLPLGFATGIFSMSEAPGTATLVGMVITAIVALYLTIGALVNAKPLRHLIVDPIIQVSHICAKEIVYYPVYFYLGYLYYPTANTKVGGRVSDWYQRLQDRAEKANVFQEAKKNYEIRKKNGRNSTEGGGDGNPEEARREKAKEKRSQSHAQSESGNQAAEKNQEKGSTRTAGSHSRTENQRSSPPVDLESGQDA